MTVFSIFSLRLSCAFLMITIYIVCKIKLALYIVSFPPIVPKTFTISASLWQPSDCMYLLISHLLERLSSSSRKLCKAQKVYHTLSQTSIPCNGMPDLRTRNLPFKSPEVHSTSFLILSIHLLKRFRPTNVICLPTCNVVPKPRCIFWTVNF